MKLRLPFGVHTRLVSFVRLIFLAPFWMTSFSFPGRLVFFFLCRLSRDWNYVTFSLRKRLCARDTTLCVVRLQGIFSCALFLTSLFAVFSVSFFCNVIEKFSRYDSSKYEGSVCYFWTLYINQNMAYFEYFVAHLVALFSLDMIYQNMSEVCATSERCTSTRTWPILNTS